MYTHTNIQRQEPTSDPKQNRMNVKLNEDAQAVAII